MESNLFYFLPVEGWSLWCFLWLSCSRGPSTQFYLSAANGYALRHSLPPRLHRHFTPSFGSLFILISPAAMHSFPAAATLNAFSFPLILLPLHHRREASLVNTVPWYFFAPSRSQFPDLDTATEPYFYFSLLHYIPYYWNVFCSTW